MRCKGLIICTYGCEDKRATPFVKRNIRLYCHLGHLKEPVAFTPFADSKRLAMELMEHRLDPHKQWWSCNYF